MDIAFRLGAMDLRDIIKSSPDFAVPMTGNVLRFLPKTLSENVPIIFQQNILIFRRQGKTFEVAV